MKQTLVSEFMGTAMLLIGVVGSGIAAETLSGGNVAIALLANAIATGCMLYVLITCLSSVSGAHFNPAVTIAFWVKKQISLRTAFFYCLSQITGAIVGVWLTHAIYGLEIMQISQTDRFGGNLWISEAFATFGLLFVIFGGIKFAPDKIATLVAVYITGAYWFTSSTSFANPAVTIGRLFSDTFAGISPTSVPPFIICQLAIVVPTVLFFNWLWAKD